MTQNSIELSQKSKQIQSMFDKISSRYNFLNRLLSFGQDVRWRRNLIKKIPLINTNNGVIYDVATGTGDVLFSFIYNRSDYNKLIGFDISQGMLSQATLKNTHKNIEFIQANAENLPVESQSADALTISFGFRNVDNQEKALSEFYRVLKNNGVLILLDFFPAKNSFFQIFFNFYFNKILPLIGGIFSDKSAYSYLPKSVNSMPSAQKFKSILESHGFHSVESKSWLSGSTVVFKCTKKV